MNGIARWPVNRLAEINVFRFLQELIYSSDSSLTGQIKTIHYLLDFAVLSLEKISRETQESDLVSRMTQRLSGPPS
jgi:hypothetical protein